MGNSLIDRQRVERSRRRQGLQPSSPGRSVLCCEDPESSLAHGDNGHSDALGRARGKRSIQLDGDEDRRVGERELAINMLAGRSHPIGRSSVVPDRRSASC